MIPAKSIVYESFRRWNFVRCLACRRIIYLKGLAFEEEVIKALFNDVFFTINRVFTDIYVFETIKDAIENYIKVRIILYS